MADLEKLIDTKFDADQKEVLIQLFKQVKDEAKAEAAAEFKDKLAQEGVKEDEFFTASKTERVLQELDKKAKSLRAVWDNNGVNPKSGRRYDIQQVCAYDHKQRQEVLAWIKDNDPEFMEDTQFSTDQPLLIPRVVTEFVREAIEPRMVLTPLLTRVNYSAGTHITFPSASAMGPAAFIPEGGEYPERRLEWAGSVTATIGKHGLAVKMTDEMIRYSQWDVMGMHIRKAGDALVRHKERQVADMLFAQSTTDFNNDGGTPTTGRGKDGAANGSFTLDDLLVMYANAVNQGWAPDTLIMHPMGWIIFARDDVLRTYGFMNNKNIWMPYEGQPGSAPQWSGGGFINDPRHVSDPNQISSTYNPVPDLFPFAPLRVVVSPYVNYDATNNVTDIYLADSREIGYYVVDEEVATEEFDDPARDIRKVKFRERYAVAAPFDTRVRKAANVVITRGYDFDDRLTWDAGVTELPDISFDLEL